jgi:hypothetical protein
MRSECAAPYMQAFLTKMVGSEPEETRSRQLLDDLLCKPPPSISHFDCRLFTITWGICFSLESQAQRVKQIGF